MQECRVPPRCMITRPIRRPTVQWAIIHRVMETVMVVDIWVLVAAVAAATLHIITITIIRLLVMDTTVRCQAAPILRTWHLTFRRLLPVNIAMVDILGTPHSLERRMDRLSSINKAVGAILLQMFFPKVRCHLRQ